MYFSVPTWICVVPQREKKVRRIHDIEERHEPNEPNKLSLRVDETTDVWSLDCYRYGMLKDMECSKEDCIEQQKALQQIGSLVDISIMIETNDDPTLDQGNKDDLREMFRSAMAIRYGISGPTTEWDFDEITQNVEGAMKASSWALDDSLSESYYGDPCKAWRPLSERASYQKNLDACYDGSTYESPDECMEFQRWIKEEIESNNIYYALSKYKGTQRLLFIRLKLV